MPMTNKQLADLLELIPARQPHRGYLALAAERLRVLAAMATAEQNRDDVVLDTPNEAAS